MDSHIHIGTSGWSYRHWRGLFYPQKLASAKWLAHYSTFFSTTEINGSFYRLPTIETVEKWTAQVRDDFLFCPKMSRYLTHMKKLREPEEPLDRFFSVFEPMKRKMGPILVQLPSMLKFTYDVAEHFYRLLKFSYHPYAFVMEVRHPSWFAEESLTLMTAFDIGLVISQSGNVFPYSEMITAKNIYIRFHGPDALYASAYSDEMLQEFAGKFRRWVADGHEVWAYFNNDIHGYAPVDAKRLQRFIK
ncbi:DUF72 domain-containing protein [Flavisolibacter nicotianae]|uniref:DUF72 domain-containing protein n=1 Tax=Flavisolibacter nicotianae TaxID=2364882 RepID=UPI000EAE7638|nr:DUF72 domain-containing protein [Flavisolibacter nicotianae]